MEGFTFDGVGDSWARYVSGRQPSRTTRRMASILYIATLCWATASPLKKERSVAVEKACVETLRSELLLGIAVLSCPRLGCRPDGVPRDRGRG